MQINLIRLLCTRELFYFLAASVLLITGIGLKSAAASGLGLYMFYSGRKSIFISEETSLLILKINLLWDLIFLAISVLMLFSVVKVILNIFLQQEATSVSHWLILACGLGLLYFETLFRITDDKKNRVAVFLLMVLLVLSAASLILGGFWLKTDLILGFLSLTVTVIISFRKAYLELTEILS